MLSKYDYPRPEYPLPERQRGFLEGCDWINLNGPWQFRFDGERKGIAEKWYDPAGQDWREQIIVPFCWESLAAWGEGDAAGNDNYYAMRVFKNPLEVTRENHRAADRYEIGWYRRLIEIPDHPAWEGKQVILTIGAADFFTQVWCNGKLAGSHEGGYEPIELDITETLELLPSGRRGGILVIRVEDPMDNRQQPVGKQWEWYTTTSGIWQTVFLEPRSKCHISGFRVYTDIDHKRAEFEINVFAPLSELELSIDVIDPDGLETNQLFKITGASTRVSVDIDPCILWDPNDPQLYKLTLGLLHGNRVLDKVHSYFGMRKIDFVVREENSPGALRLNNQPIYLRGALYQSYFPDGVYTAGDLRTIRNDIQVAKQAGFDFLRIHIKMDDPMVYYFADTLGILLMVDFPNFGEGGDTPLARERFEKMMRIAVERDFNHPSIFAWCLFNETWGFGGQTELIKHFSHQYKKLPAIPSPPPEKPLEAAKMSNISAHEWVNMMWILAKKLDPTRLIEDMSVVHWDHLEYYQHVETDINSWHFYDSSYESAREHIEKVVKSTYSGSSFNFVEGYKQSNQPLINSEYGGVGALDGDVDISWSFKFLTNELRRHSALSAYVFTQLHDVEWECNGFLNYDRTPKQFGFDPALINSGDVLPIDAPPIQKIPLGGILKVPVYASHYSRKHREQVFLEWRLSGLDTAGKIHQDLSRNICPIPFPFREVKIVKELEFNLPSWPMLCKLTVTAYTGHGERIAQNYVECLVSNGYPEQVEETPRARILRARPFEWIQAQWNGGHSTKEEAEKNDSCFGHGAGFFEWQLPLRVEDLKKAHRLRVLCEASSCRVDTSQTSLDAHPSTLQIFLNGVILHHGSLPDHPHDARGSLSYLRGGRGAYGYLEYSLIEGLQLQEIIHASSGDCLTLRCEVPETASAIGGVVIYGSESGRYPICPTVVVEW